MRILDTSDITALDIVTLPVTKAYLRVDHSADDDLIGDLVDAALLQVQAMTNTRAKTVTAYGYLEGFYNCDFPVGPVNSVTAVEYKPSGSETYTTLDASKYKVRTNSHPARIEFYNYPSPETETLERVRISFMYGYDQSVHRRPKQFETAVKMLVAHYYDNRSPVTTGPAPKEVPHHVQSIISTIRLL